MSDITKKVDAKSRALRTFFQGLAVDGILVLSVVMYNATSSNDFSWNGTYWSGLLLLVARTLIHSAASYAMRYFKSPPSE
jgi:hypothetical protein